MDIKTICIFFAGLILLANLSCKDCNGFQNASYRGGYETMRPDIDSIPVGDTLIYTSKIPFNLLNNDSVVINYAGASNVVTDVNFTVIQGLNLISYAVDSFKLFPIEGSFIDNSKNPHFAETISFVPNDTSYDFSMGIIALKPGIYTISVISIYEARKKCFNAGIQIDFVNTNQHLYYLQNIYHGGAPLDQEDQTSSYCFKVY